MATVNATLSPSSLQLRLAFRCRKSPPIFVRARVKQLDRRFRVHCFAQDGEKNRQETSWALDSDNLSSWSGLDESDESLGSQKKKWLGGMVGAGVAGVIIVAGLTFAAVSLSKPKQKQEMKPLTTEQEISVISDELDDKHGEDESYVKQEDCSLERETALQVLPGKVLIPAVVDQVQGQALAALQVLKVIEADVQPSDLCSRREYARWLVSASSVLSRNTVSKVYPAMYIENVTKLAFDDITPEDPDFASIQGLAEAGLIASKLSRYDMQSSLDEDQSPFHFCAESPLSRQDLVSWKMATEKRQLPEVDRKTLYQLTGFIDIDKVNPDAYPALVADISAGENGIVSLAFGFTRLFQPNKPVTKAQAAVALATGEASDMVNEELARIEAESMAENAVAAHNALVAQVEKDINACFEKELSIEREKIYAMEKMAEEARCELESLRASRAEDSIVLMKERAVIESEMEVLSKLRHEVEEQLHSLMSNKVEIAYEKERISKLCKEAEDENKEIARLQYELEVERKALSIARVWAEDEAKRAREQARTLEEARDSWERRGIKVVVDKDLSEETSPGISWVNAGKQFSVEESVSRAESLSDKLKVMAAGVRGKSRDIIHRIIEKLFIFISKLKEWACKAGKASQEMRDAAISKATVSTQELQQSTVQLGSTLKDGAKKVAEDCRDGVEKLTQKFKA